MIRRQYVGGSIEGGTRDDIYPIHLGVQSGVAQTEGKIVARGKQQFGFHTPNRDLTGIVALRDGRIARIRWQVKLLMFQLAIEIGDVQPNSSIEPVRLQTGLVVR